MICFIASVDTAAWRKNLSLYQPTRGAGRHGNSVDSKLRRGPLFSKLKAALARMTGGRAAGESDEPDTPAIEYQGYRIRPTPYRTERQYQTAGIIEKNFPDPETTPVRSGRYASQQG